MNTKTQSFDTFQIVGFIISVVISIGLMLAKQDTISSVTLGLVLATLTQLFDLQIRQSVAEEKTLQAYALNRTLYEDKNLFSSIQQIVDEYVSIKNDGFELFKLRADDALFECRDILHSMAEGRMITEPQSRFVLGETFKDAKRSIKQSIVRTNASYWRTTYADKGLEMYAAAIKRGVTFTRIFVQTPEILREIIDILENQQNQGIDIYIVSPDDISESFHEDYILVDDNALARLELNADGYLKRQSVSIDSVEIERMVKDFNMLKRHAKKLDDVIDSLR